MVCASTSESSMRMRSERSNSKPLHNFTLPFLRWGSQKQLRCMKVNSKGVHISAVNRRSEKVPPRVSKSRIDDYDDGNDDGIDAVREKLMFDLKTAADKMKEAIFKKEKKVFYDYDDDDGDDVAMEESAVVVAAETEGEPRPWNLRTRRAACKAPNVDCGGSKIDVKKGNTENSPLRIGGSEKKRKAKLVVPLSKREIEEDFMKMSGVRPPRRPKKRNRIVQKQLDTLFPGLWLSEITADLYKVTEVPENGKM